MNLISIAFAILFIGLGIDFSIHYCLRVFEYSKKEKNDNKEATTDGDGDVNSDISDENNYLKDEIKLDDIFVCYHDDHDNCKCRKPKPGLLLEASKKWNIDLKKSYMIGDRWRDIEAGRCVECKTIFIDCNYKETKPKNPNFTTDSLLNSVHIIEKLQDRKI